MLQIAIENPSIEEYFKTQENIKNFLEVATNLDLLSVIGLRDVAKRNSVALARTNQRAWTYQIKSLS